MQATKTGNFSHHSCECWLRQNKYVSNCHQRLHLSTCRKGGWSIFSIKLTCIVHYESPFLCIVHASHDYSPKNGVKTISIQVMVKNKKSNYICYFLRNQAIRPCLKTAKEKGAVVCTSNPLVLIQATPRFDPKTKIARRNNKRDSRQCHSIQLFS